MTLTYVLLGIAVILAILVCMMVRKDYQDSRYPTQRKSRTARTSSRRGSRDDGGSDWDFGDSGSSDD